LSIESVEGKGSTFTCNFPAHRAVAHPDAVAALENTAQSIAQSIT
jgi:hypothetical protein